MEEIYNGDLVKLEFEILQDLDITFGWVEVWNGKKVVAKVSAISENLFTGKIRPDEIPAGRIVIRITCCRHKSKTDQGA